MDVNLTQIQGIDYLTLTVRTVEGSKLSVSNLFGDIEITLTTAKHHKPEGHSALAECKESIRISYRAAEIQALPPSHIPPLESYILGRVASILESGVRISATSATVEILAIIDDGLVLVVSEEELAGTLTARSLYEDLPNYRIITTKY